MQLPDTRIAFRKQSKPSPVPYRSACLGNSRATAFARSTMPYADPIVRKEKAKVYSHLSYIRRKDEVNRRARAWTLANPEKHIASVKHWQRTEHGKKKTSLFRKAWRNDPIKGPEWRLKRRAQSRVRWAVRTGKLVRGPCVQCGEPKTHGHHSDYSKPLDVVWLCAPCHRRLHAINKRMEIK